MHVACGKVGGQLVDHGWARHGVNETERGDRAPSSFSVNSNLVSNKAEEETPTKIGRHTLFVFNLERPLVIRERAQKVQQTETIVRRVLRFRVAQTCKITCVLDVLCTYHRFEIDVAVLPKALRSTPHSVLPVPNTDIWRTR